MFNQVEFQKFIGKGCFQEKLPFPSQTEAPDDAVRSKKRLDFLTVKNVDFIVVNDGGHEVELVAIDVKGIAADHPAVPGNRALAGIVKVSC